MVFTQLQVRTAYSLLESPTTIDALVATAKQMGYQALAITDHNVVYGLIDFYKACQKAEIQPILGLEVDLVGLLPSDEAQAYPYLIYAQDNEGYEALLSISSKRMLHPEAPLTLADISQWLTHVFVVLPPRSELEYVAGQTDLNGALTYLQSVKELVPPKNLLIGITLQGHFSRQLSRLKAISEHGSIPLCALGKVDYLNESQAFDAQVLQHISAGTKMNPQDYHQLAEGPFYLQTPETVAQAFKSAGFETALKTTEWLVAQCHVSLILNQRTLLPKFQTPADISADAYLKQLVQQGLTKRLGGEIPGDYQERANYELGVITKMGFSDYFLIVWDVIHYAQKAGIMTGAGRGSAAGSLVAYALEITEVDPLVYHLLFERFLNPSRANMPDIDLDIPDNRRDELLQYVYQRYGENHMAQIITFGTLAAKQSLRDVCRVMGLNPLEANNWSKAVPNILKITLKQALEQSTALQALVAENETNRLIFQTASELEGLPRHYSTHAAGVVLSDAPLTQKVALQNGGTEIPLTQYPMGNVAEVGLLKMDFLGLKNLNILAQSVADVQKEAVPDFDQKQIPLDDAKTLALFQEGDTNGVFQFESEGIKRVLRRLHPDSFEDIVATNALYRPGPMENIDTFIARKNGQAPVVYPDEVLEPILKPTYGILVYQEQVMQAASAMGGFTLAEADLLRRAMSKKKKAVIDDNRQRFIDGAVKKGFGVESARLVYEYIENFANYGFNRSHAVAYSKLAFWLAYLKCHFPASFFTALLNSTVGNQVKTRLYLQEAKQRQVQILGPDINLSEGSFTVSQNQIRFGFVSIKGLRRDFIQAILEARQKGPFQEMTDFLQRLPKRFVKQDYLQPLIEVGAFDTLSPNRQQLLTNLDKLIATITLAGESMSLFELLTPEMAYVDDFSKTQKVDMEAQLLGTYISGHPLERYKSLSFQNIDALLDQKQGTVLFYVRRIKTIRTKNGDQMAFLNGEDLSQSFSVTVFPSVYKRIQSWLKSGQALVITGKFEWQKDHTPGFVAQRIEPADAVQKQQTATVPVQKLYLQFLPEKDTPAFREAVYEILTRHSGQTPVVAVFKRENKTILLKQAHWVTWSPSLSSELRTILGAKNIIFK